MNREQWLQKHLQHAERKREAVLADMLELDGREPAQAETLGADVHRHSTPEAGRPEAI